VVYELATARLTNESAAFLKGFQVFPAAKEKLYEHGAKNGADTTDAGVFRRSAVKRSP
jgi:hypothetical protein